MGVKADGRQEVEEVGRTRNSDRRTNDNVKDGFGVVLVAGTDLHGAVDGGEDLSCVVDEGSGAVCAVQGREGRGGPGGGGWHGFCAGRIWAGG